MKKKKPISISFSSISRHMDGVINSKNKWIYFTNTPFLLVCLIFLPPFSLNDCNKITTIVRCQTICTKPLCPAHKVKHSISLMWSHITIDRSDYFMHDNVNTRGYYFRRRNKIANMITHTHYTKFSNIYGPFSFISTFAWHSFFSSFSCHRCFGDSYVEWKMISIDAVYNDRIESVDWYDWKIKYEKPTKIVYFFFLP